MNDLGHTIDIVRSANNMAMDVVNVCNLGMFRKEERAGIYHAYAMSQKKFIETITRRYSISKQLPRLPRSSRQVERFARIHRMTGYQWRLLMQRYPELKLWMDKTEERIKARRKATK